MYFLSVFLRPFRLVSNLTPSAFANNTSFIIPQIVELRFPSGILISFRSFEMMPPFTPQGWFLVASYLFKKNPTVYLTENSWSKRGCCLSFSYLRYWLTSKIDYGATTIYSSSGSALIVCSCFFYYPLSSWRYSFSWVFSSEVFRILKAWSNLFSCLNSR